MPETKRERFIRIAEARTNKILDTIRLLGNCSNKTNYEYNEEDVRLIFSTIDKEIKYVKNMFLGIENKDERFTLR